MRFFNVGPPGLTTFSKALIYNYLKLVKSKKRVKIRVKFLAVDCFEFWPSFDAIL